MTEKDDDRNELRAAFRRVLKDDDRLRANFIPALRREKTLRREKQKLGWILAGGWACIGFFFCVEDRETMVSWNTLLCSGLFALAGGLGSVFAMEMYQSAVVDLLTRWQEEDENEDDL